MSPSRRTTRVSPAVAFFLALAPVLLLARCGLWPTFPDELLRRDGGMGDGAVTDAPAVDVPRFDAPIMPGDTGPEAPTMGPNGFLNCPNPPAGPFTPEAVVAGSVGARDLAFDGRGRVAVVARQITLLTPTGMPTEVASEALGGLGIRYLPSGSIAVTSALSMMPAAVRVVDPSAMPPAVSTIATFDTSSFPYSLAVNNNGTVFVSVQSSMTGGVYRIPAGGTMAVPVTTEVRTPAAIALTPDFRRLFIGNPGRGIMAIDLAPDGSAMGGAAVYAMTSLASDGMAFDECGNLYFSDNSRARIYRVRSGGGAPVEIASGMLSAMRTLNPWGLAFGQGAGFDPRALYFVDSTTGEIFKINVGVRGARVVTPGM